MTKAQPEHLLPRNERIRKAAKIIDENRSLKVGGCTDSIANMLDWHDWRCTGMNALRRTQSKEARRTERQVAAWLNKGVRLLNRLSSWPLGFENFREDVRRWARLYEDEEEESGTATPSWPSWGGNRPSKSESEITAGAGRLRNSRSRSGTSASPPLGGAPIDRRAAAA
jgi:hypothetical protein